MGYNTTPSNAHIQLHDKQKYRLYALRTTIWQGTQSHFQCEEDKRLTFQNPQGAYANTRILIFPLNPIHQLKTMT